MARRETTIGEVRSVFALAAEGKMQKTIAHTMGIRPSTVSRILRRDAFKNVMIPQHVLDAAAQHGTCRNMKRKKKTVKDTRVQTTLDDLGLVPVQAPTNGAMPQAMKDADPAYKKGDNNIGGTRQGPGYVIVEPVPKSGLAAKQGRAGVKQARTKAEAMTRVLGYVAEGNVERARMTRLRTELTEAEAQAKRSEDRAFAAITALGDLGFTPQFLSSFLEECGLCTDGLFSTE